MKTPRTMRANCVDARLTSLRSELSNRRLS